MPELGPERDSEVIAEYLLGEPKPVSDRTSNMGRSVLCTERPRGHAAGLQHRRARLPLFPRTCHAPLGAPPPGQRTGLAPQDIEWVLKLQNEEMTTRMAHIRHHQEPDRGAIENSDRPVFEVLFAKFNVEELPELARQETGVPAIPTLPLSRKGKAEERLWGPALTMN